MDVWIDRLLFGLAHPESLAAGQLEDRDDGAFLEPIMCYGNHFSGGLHRPRRQRANMIFSARIVSRFMHASRRYTARI